MIHTPVLVKEVLQYLAPASNEYFIDATVGQGGHSARILALNGPEGRVLGIDWDQRQIENSRKALAEAKGRAVLIHGSYANIQQIAEQAHFGPVHGILLDLGYSSWQLEASGKGFSFLKDEPLDMRYDQMQPLTARRIVNEYPAEQLEHILQEYGEERFARRIAQNMVRQRGTKAIESTFDLVGVIQEAVPPQFRHRRIHYATRTFQALRIAVNHELENLEAFLPQALQLLAPGGRLVIISFHSLEDRIVKHFFAQAAQDHLVELATKKPIEAADEEIAANARARSAKLRAIVKK